MWDSTTVVQITCCFLAMTAWNSLFPCVMWCLGKSSFLLIHTSSLGLETIRLRHRWSKCPTRNGFLIRSVSSLLPLVIAMKLKCQPIDLSPCLVLYRIGHLITLIRTMWILEFLWDIREDQDGYRVKKSVDRFSGPQLSWLSLWQVSWV